MDINLTRDEKVVLRLRTHGKVLVVPALWLAVTAAAVFGLFRLVALNPGRVLDTAAGQTVEPYLPLGILAVALIFALVKVVAPILRWRKTVYVITDRRLCYRTGVLSRTGRDIPFHRINDVTYEYGIIDRILRCGTLVVSDATEKDGLRLFDVPHVQQVAERIQELVFANYHGEAGRSGPETRTNW